MLLVTGELSGERHASLLVRQLSFRLPSLEVYAVGGEMLRAQGVRIISPYAHISVTGLWEVLFKIPAVLEVERRVRRFMEEERPDLFVPVDFPGLNLRLCKLANSYSIPVVYFIPPQVWAWGERRLETMRACVRRVISFLPFERDFFLREGLDCVYVGHPYLFKLESVYRDRGDFLFSQGVRDGTIITFMPGSRKNEVERHMPLLLDLLPILRAKIKQLRLLVPVACGLDGKLLKGLTRGAEDTFLLKGLNIDALKYCDLAVIASGSACVEAMSLCTPSIVIYRLSPLSYFIARRKVRVRYVSIPNLLADREVFPEFIQRLSPRKIAERIFFMLEHGLERQREELMVLRDRFQVSVDPYRASAEAVAQILEEHHGPLH